MPRLLLVDASAMGGPSATGHFLATRFDSWPAELRCQLWADAGEPTLTSSAGAVTGDALQGAIEDFAPELVFARPDARSAALLDVLDALDLRVPLVVEVVDDWIARLEVEQPDAVERWADRLRSLIERSDACFAISPELAATLKDRYGTPFDVISNVVRLADWDGLAGPPESGPISFRFSGQLAYRKGGSTVAAIALGVQGATNVDAELVVRSAGAGHDATYLAGLDGLSRIRIEPYADTEADYRAYLAGAGANVVAFNFDSATRGYLAGSFANRIPELLAAGRPILAVGPPDLASIRFLQRSGAAHVVTSPDAVELHRAISLLASDGEYRAELAAAAKETATAFEWESTVPAFHERLRAIAHGETSEPIHGPRSLVRSSPQTPTTSLPSPADLDRLRALRNAHAGETCVVVGNGPSLNDTPLELLDDEVVFASNAIFLLFDEVDWRPTYYASVDSRFLPDRHDDVDQLLRTHPQMTGFFPTMLELHDGSGDVVPVRQLLEDQPNRVLFLSQHRKPAGTHTGAFSLDAVGGLIQPSTVTITLMQLAAHMGFARIVLIGCDTSYSIPDTVEISGPKAEGHDEGMLLTSTADDDVNHFRPDYFGAGRAWHHPKVDHMIRHYEAAKTVLDLQGVEVINATVGGALEVFPRMSLADALG